MQSGRIVTTAMVTRNQDENEDHLIICTSGVCDTFGKFRRLHGTAKNG